MGLLASAYTQYFHNRLPCHIMQLHLQLLKSSLTRRTYQDKL